MCVHTAATTTATFESRSFAKVLLLSWWRKRKKEEDCTRTPSRSPSPPLVRVSVHGKKRKVNDQPLLRLWRGEEEEEEESGLESEVRNGGKNQWGFFFGRVGEKQRCQSRHAVMTMLLPCVYCRASL